MLLIIRSFLYPQHHSAIFKIIFTESTILIIAEHGKVEDNWMELIDILCNEVNLYHQAQEQIKANGIVIVNQRGIIANPAVRIGENAVVQIHKLVDALGLTPKSADKIKKNSEEEDKDFLTGLLNG